MSQGFEDYFSVPIIVDRKTELNQVTPLTFLDYDPPQASMVRVTLNGALNNVSGNSISLTINLQWFQNGTHQIQEVCSTALSVPGKSACGGVIGVFSDAKQFVAPDYAPAGFGPGDTFDVQFCIEQLP